MPGSLLMFQQILAAYDFLHTRSEVEPIKNDLINQTWRIKNSHGDFILQRINHSIFKNPSAIASNLRMLDHYLAQTYPEYLFIAPGKTCKNEEMVFIEGKGYFRLFPFVKQSHTIHAFPLRNYKLLYRIFIIFPCATTNFLRHWKTEIKIGLNNQRN